VTVSVMTRVRNVPGGVAADLAVEDEADLVGAADVEVVADGLLEEDPSWDGLVEHLSEGELGLQDRDLVAVAGGVVGGGEGVGQPAQPLAQQPVDDLLGQSVADRLHRGHVVECGESVVQCGVPDPSFGGLTFGVFVAVDA
jgi:hypothetical protein